MDAGLEPLTPLPSLDEQVYEALLRAILSSKLAPGVPIVESRVARQLGVSKTPVRAALQRLEGELLVRRSENYRYRVADLSTEAMRSVYLLRSRLEGLVAFLATPHMGPEDFDQAQRVLDAADRALDNDDIQRCVNLGRQFHRLLLRRADDEFLADFLRRLNAHVERGRQLAALSQRTSRHSVQQHRKVIQAMMAGDADRAECHMRDHIIQFIDEIQGTQSIVEPPAADEAESARSTTGSERVAA